MHRRCSALPDSDLFSTITSFKLTAAEIAAGVTPVNYVYAPGDVRRYGADPTGSADSGPAIQIAWKCNGTIQIPAGTYAIKTQQIFNGANIEIFGAGISMTTLIFSAAGQFIFGDSTNTTRNFYLQFEKLTINGNNRGQATTAIKVYSFSEFHFRQVYFIEIQGPAIYAEITQDGSVIDCQFIYCGDNAALGGGHANWAPLHLPYLSVNENNHWNIIACHFEANYFSDIYAQGKNVECDHFITKCKFGVPSYTIVSDADINQYHIQCVTVTAISIVDNWFINGGMVYLANSTVYHIMCNHGRNMSQGIWDDGGGGAAANISSNQIFGNNSATAITGSLHANHWGVRIGGINSEVGPANDISGFNVNYQVWAGATNIAVIFPVSGGTPATSAAGTLVDAGTATRLQQLDQPSVALPLLNSWAIGSFAPPAYSRSGNQVVLKGMVHGGTITGGTAIGTLPVGFRPTDSTRFFACYTDNGTTSAVGFLQVSTAGSVLIGTVPAGTTNISLDGIEFSVI